MNIDQKNINEMKKLLIIIVISFSMSSLYSQNKTIKGRVISNDFESLPQVSIMINDTIEIGKTDLDGYFELTIPDKTTTLIFGFIGCEFQTITFNDSCKYFEIILLPYFSYHIRSHKRIDRLRRKEFNKLPELQLKAYNEGKFINKEICYTPEFITDKPALDVIRKDLKEFRKINKNDFAELNIGDLVKIPFGIDTSENENWVRTTYAPCLSCTEEDYDYIIEGEIVNKNMGKLTLEIKITKMLPYEFLKYRGKILKLGSSFRYEMKYYEVIIDKKTITNK